MARVAAPKLASNRITINHRVDYISVVSEDKRTARIPDPDLPIHYTTFIWLRRRLRVVYSRAVPCKPFSGHLAAILFYANLR